MKEHSKLAHLLIVIVVFIGAIIGPMICGPTDTHSTDAIAYSLFSGALILVIILSSARHGSEIIETLVLGKVHLWPATCLLPIVAKLSAIFIAEFLLVSQASIFQILIYFTISLRTAASYFLPVLLSELFWRAFLQRKYSSDGFLKGPLLVGLVWGIWHASFQIIFGADNPFVLSPTPFLTILKAVFISFVLRYLFESSGSVWPSAIIVVFVISLNNNHSQSSFEITEPLYLEIIEIGIWGFIAQLFLWLTIKTFNQRSFK